MSFWILKMRFLKLHDPKKVNRSWRLTYNQTFDFCYWTVCEDFSPDSLWRFCPRTKSEKCPQLLNRLEYFDKLKLIRSNPSDCEMTFIVGRAPNSEKVKMALCLKLSGLLWWNFADTLILTRCSPRDCQMSFGIGRGFAEVQILKKKMNLALSLKTLWIFW